MTISASRGRWIRTGTALAMLALGGVLFVAGNTATAQESGEPSNNIADYVSSKLDDFTATIKVMQYDEAAGKKINRDFGRIYELQGDVNVHYKEENKLRLDARMKTANVIFIINGTKQNVQIPQVKINSITDIGSAPGKRKTLLDVGLISDGYLAYSNVEYKGPSNVNGIPCAKFKFTYQDKSDSSHRIIWIDPKTKVTLKREDYSQLGKLNATFYYRDPKLVAPGVWFPTRIEVFNNEGQKAGETAYKNVKVNQGVDDSLFKF
ncbi:MAG TPA: outer membrane lipoprotein-sorting protein [Chthonomonadaceae bacterium]|nr:outer membrane lipoprotein-sorting protein [Chthonomonadaceae bacterium]